MRITTILRKQRFGLRLTNHMLQTKTVLGYENNALEVDAREFAEELVQKYGFKQE